MTCFHSGSAVAHVIWNIRLAVGEFKGGVDAVMLQGPTPFVIETDQFQLTYARGTYLLSLPAGRNMI